MSAAFSHRSVLFDECIENLAIKPSGVYVDCTAGGGGHSFGIASRIPEGRLVAIDQDDAALAAAAERLEPFSDRVTFVKSNFEAVGDVLDGLGIDRISGALLDLGVSSYQLDTPERGFSYSEDAPLDMRMDPGAPLDAAQVVNTYAEEDLKRILYEYGEERFAPRIAAEIVRRRGRKPLETTGELVDAVRKAMPPKALAGGHHPAKRTFQAIRIEVNRELDVIEPALRALAARLEKGGRLCVITFHSLEDRIVKQTFADLAQGCTCPKTLPVCVCGRVPSVRKVNAKPILPGEAELAENPRSRSAKLRVVEKL